MKTALGDEASTFETAVNDALKWLEENDNATTEEYEDRLKQVEKVKMIEIIFIVGTVFIFLINVTLKIF
jgi:hypothetical protein